MPSPYTRSSAANGSLTLAYTPRTPPRASARAAGNGAAPIFSSASRLGLPPKASGPISALPTVAIQTPGARCFHSSLGTAPSETSANRSCPKLNAPKPVTTAASKKRGLAEPAPFNIRAKVPMLSVPLLFKPPPFRSYRRRRRQSSLSVFQKWGLPERGQNGAGAKMGPA